MKPILLAAIAATIGGMAPAQDALKGAELFADHCAVCHGLEARGNGPMAPVLTLQPTDLTALSAGNEGTFPTARAAARIDGRDPLVAHGSPMWVFGDFFEEQGDMVTLPLPDGEELTVSTPIADLLAFLASVQSAPTE